MGTRLVIWRLSTWALLSLRWSTIIGSNFSTRAIEVIIPGTGSWQLRDSERTITGNEGLLGRKHFLIGITRVRNEALILRVSAGRFAAGET
jgi:hypothetical protein